MAKDPKENVQGPQGDIGSQARDRTQQQGDVRPEQDIEQPQAGREQPQQPQAGQQPGYRDIGRDTGRDVQDVPRAGQKEDFDPSRKGSGGGGCG